MKAAEQTDELPLDRFLISLDKTNQYLNRVRSEGVTGRGEVDCGLQLWPR